MEMALIRESVELLVFGMGVVFAFLVTLVIATGAMSKIVHRFFPQPEPQPSPPVSSSGDVDPLTLKIIRAAIDRHRRRS